jgi:hypothetical protein
MAIFTDQPLEETLAICDGLNTTWESDEVQLCISGVFHAGAQPGEVDKQYEHFLSRVYSSQDVYYPCRTVEKKFKGQCFSQVPGRFGPSVKGQFQSCSDIPESNQVLKTDYVKRCYDSAANNVIVEANYDPAVSVKKCREYSSKPDYVKFCYGGVVRYSILRNPLLNNRYPFEICKLAETENKSYCYRALGAANNENYFDKNILKEFCAGLEEQDYLNYCLLQANVE